MYHVWYEWCHGAYRYRKAPPNDLGKVRIGNETGFNGDAPKRWSANSTNKLMHVHDVTRRLLPAPLTPEEAKDRASFEASVVNINISVSFVSA